MTDMAHSGRAGLQSRGVGVMGWNVAAVLLVSLAACTVERTAHLYPLNDAASKTGVVEGSLVGHGELHGVASAIAPGGEVFRGEYSIVAGGSVSYGNIFSGVYGSGVTIAGSGRGEASLVGNKGTSVQCEFLNDNILGHGYGACQSSTGGLYKLLY